MVNRFNEQLDKVIRGNRASLGFGQHAAAAKPRLFIMAETASMDGAKALTGADAVLVKAPCKCKSEKSGPLRGCTIGAETEHTGCDFVVLGLDSAIVNIDEDTARILHIDGELTDGQLRALAGLDPAAIIADAGFGESLTFRDLLSVQRLVDFGGKSLLLRLPKTYTKAELQALSDRGIAGVVVDAAKIDIAALRKAVEAIEPKKRGKEKATAIVTCPTPSAHTEETEPGIEPDEDE